MGNLAGRNNRRLLFFGARRPTFLLLPNVGAPTSIIFIIRCRLLDIDG